MKCPNCGNEINEEWNYCPNCHNPLKSDKIQPMNKEIIISNKKDKILNFLIICCFVIPIIFYFFGSDQFIPYLLFDILSIFLPFLYVIGVILLIYKNNSKKSKSQKKEDTKNAILGCAIGLVIFFLVSLLIAPIIIEEICGAIVSVG